jgi:glutathione S-transferase
MRQVTLYGKPECSLCDEVRGVIQQLGREGLRFRLVEVDIESDERLHTAYLERIPVVEVDGEQVSELVLDEARLRAALAEQRRGGEPGLDTVPA